MPHPHFFEAHLHWTGAEAGPATNYATYSRAVRVAMPGKPDLETSAAPAFRGDASRHNPEDLLLAAVAVCHLLSYLALAVRAGI